MKKAIIYSFLVVFAACTTNKKIQKAQKEIDKTVAVRPITVVKPLVVAIKSRYLLKDSSAIRIFMELDIENLNKQRVIQQLNDNFRFNWLLQPDYGIRERLGSGKIDLNEQNILLKEGKVLLNFEIPRPKNLAKGLLLTEVFQLEDSKKSNNDLVIDFNGTRINDRFGIYIDNLTMPIFRNFINKTDSFQLKSVMNHSRELYLVRYKNDFTAAQSPMATSIRPNIASLTIEETIRVQTNTSIKLSQEGLYQIVEDTNSTSTGFGFMLTFNLWMYNIISTDLAFTDLVIPIFLQGAASGMLFVPIATFILSTVPVNTGISGSLVAGHVRFFATLQSFAGLPVASFVNKKTLGHAKGKISLGCVTSKTIRCLPLIFANQASGSSGEIFSVAAKVPAFRFKGKPLR